MTETQAHRSQPKTGQAATTPYTQPHEHLLDELRWLNRLLAAQVLASREAGFYEHPRDFRSFFVAPEEIDALLEAEVFERKGKNGCQTQRVAALLQQAGSMRREINHRVQASIAGGMELPLAALARSFRLSEFEMGTLLICLAPQIDARYEKIYAYLQNDVTRKAASTELILSLLCESIDERLQCLPFLDTAAKLHHFRLIETVELEPGTSAARRYLRCCERIVQFAIGTQTGDPRTRDFLRLLPPLPWDRLVITQQVQTIVQQVIRRLQDQRPCVYLHGPRGAGKKSLARAICGTLGVRLGVVNLAELARAAIDFRHALRLLLREGLLQPCLLYFDHIDQFLEAADARDGRLLAFLDELQPFRITVFIASQSPVPSALLRLPQIIPIELPALDAAGQQQLWQTLLRRPFDTRAGELAQTLAARFNLSFGQIVRATRRATCLAAARNSENARLTPADLFTCCRAESQPKLSTLARKIEPKYSWQDIVLPDRQMAQLRELAQQVKCRRTVMDEWGFARKMNLGRGLNALFAGESGTGKTMAAEVIANDLGLELYKVDLSAVVSKYIGETEKNLRQVFDEAENSNAILFFDEADALLGKRSEVQDAHDRYANIEIAYLLQRMEEYGGVTVLATNLRQNIDEAFTRRFRFIIEFPFPEAPDRLRIWKNIWPEATPLSPDLDLAYFAQRYRLTGGSIRNIALAAAFLALDNGRVVGNSQILHAVKREFQKMGRLIKEEDFVYDQARK